MRNAVLILICLALAPFCRARTITVDDDGPADFNNIQAAIDDANDGDTVEIQPGTYTGPGNRDIDFKGKAITVRSTDPNDPNIVAATVIDCNGTESHPHRGFNFVSGENHDAVLEGLTITNGYVRGHGGAIICDPRSSPTIRSCVIVGNVTERAEGLITGAGGGIYCGNQSNPTIENCTILNNTVDGPYYDSQISGGGISCEESSPSITNCTVTGNKAGRGGGISSGEYSTPRIADCIISDNNATVYGGGLACGASHRQTGATISRCIIRSNSAAWGAGISCSRDQLGVNSCLIAGNMATDKGGGILSFQSASVLSNCTITNNSAGSGGGVYCSGGLVTAYNCILWGNIAEQGTQVALDNCGLVVGSDIRVEYSNIQGGAGGTYWPGCPEWKLDMEPGNIALDPAFLDANNMDFRLHPDSPCIDKGTNAYAGATDIQGNPRSLDGDRDEVPVVDMGAYEALPCDKPVIDFSALEVHIFADEDDPDPQPQTAGIRNRGAGTLNWTLTCDCDWLSLIPDTGSSTPKGDEVLLRVNVDALRPGTYDCNLIITDPLAANSPKSVPVKLHVLGEQVHVPIQFPTIQEAIDHATIGGTVVVADGIYTGPGNRNIDFKGKAITVCSENGPESCVIDCQGSSEQRQRGFHFQNGEDANSVLDSLTVINAAGYWRSGAVYCENSGPTVSNCRLANNPGGGIRCDGQASPVVGHCIINGNGCFGVYCAENSRPTIGNCIITGSDYHWPGSGISCYGSSQPTISNCTIYGNYEAAISCGYKTDAIVKNCVIWDNAIVLGKLAHAEVMYSNVQGGYAGTGNIDADPCFVEPGYWADANDPDIVVEPNDPNAVWVNGDYHLQSQAGRWDAKEGRWTMDEVTSPCIDAGDPMSPVGHEPFPNGGIVNMGAYGGTVEASKSYFGEPVCETIVGGDINGDCIVDFRDFLFIGLHWMEDNN